MHILLDKGYFMLAYSHYLKPPWAAYIMGKYILGSNLFLTIQTY